MLDTDDYTSLLIQILTDKVWDTSVKIIYSKRLFKKPTIPFHPRNVHQTHYVNTYMCEWKCKKKNIDGFGITQCLALGEVMNLEPMMEHHQSHTFL